MDKEQYQEMNSEIKRLEEVERTLYEVIQSQDKEIGRLKREKLTVSKVLDKKGDGQIMREITLVQSTPNGVVIHII